MPGREERDRVDQRILERIRAGDEAALQALMDRYWGPLLRYSERTLPPDDAIDIVQEVFVRVWESRKAWVTTGSVQGYLYRIARNRILEQARHLEVQRRTEPEVRVQMAPNVESPQNHTAQEELRSALKAALDELSPRRREAIVLVRLQGLSLAEAAEVMGISRQTVANNISLGLAELEPLLEDFRG